MPNFQLPCAARTMRDKTESVQDDSTGKVDDGYDGGIQFCHTLAKYLLVLTWIIIDRCDSYDSMKKNLIRIVKQIALHDP